MYLFLLITHFIGLALGVGTGFAALALDRASRDLAPPERMQFMLRASAIRINGSVGSLLLLLSGLGMLFYRGVRETFAWGGGAFHAKLTLIVLLIGVFGYMQVLNKKARVAQDASALAKIPKIASVMLLLNVLIIVSAVVAFK
jgi:uncharacterized membrane protein